MFKYKPNAIGIISAGAPQVKTHPVVFWHTTS